jgi:glycosyltransferase involved in cell wall biosynthesis
MNPLVSIVVTSYNHADYLDRRVDSLIKQTYPEKEIIVIDDCSTDNSRMVLSKYGNHPFIKLTFLDKNVGYAHACNLGVKMSAGNYIMFAECDDYNHPEHLSTLMEVLSGYENVGVAYCRSNIVDSEDRFLNDDFQSRSTSFKEMCRNNAIISSEQMMRFLLFSCVIPNMSAALIRRKYFELAGGLAVGYKACADWDFWCRIAHHCDFFYVYEPLNNFRSHPTTVRSSAGIQRQATEMIELLYRASSEIHLTLYDKCKFKVNMGYIWGRFFRSDPLDWIKSFPHIWAKSLKFDRFLIIYLFIYVVIASSRKLIGLKAE